MLFNSLQFLLFFPLTVIIFFLIPSRFKLFFLLLASCIFYAAAVPSYLVIIFLSIIIDYVAAFIISRSRGHKRKIFLSVSLIANIGLLCVFKYVNFFNENISYVANMLGFTYDPLILTLALPIGLSFHTFQGMSYIIEVYRKNVKPEKNILKYSLFVMFFPQLVAGPIERPQQLLTQFSKKFVFSYEDVRNGLQLMLWGMFKKVAIADRIAVYVDPVFGAPQSFDGVSLAVASILFAFQIYYDFSGYTDIARGAARILGYRLEINFNNPYMSVSIQEFWRRWHISLSSWFRDYLYIPLGGNRKSKIYTYRNIMITFLLCGLWHGASWHFVMWGALNGFYLVLFQMWNSLNIKVVRIPIVISILFTFFLTCLTWVFFRADSVGSALLIINKIFMLPVTHIETSQLFQSFILQQNKAEFSLILMLIASIEVVQTNKDTVMKRFRHQPKAIRWMVYCSLLWIIILAGKFGERAFIYFSF